MTPSHDKVAITGGSSGIGKAAAIQLAREGASVAILARNPDRLAEALEEVKAAARDGERQRFAAVSVDVTDARAVEEAAAEVLEALGGLDLLVCNAGFARCAPVAEAGLEDFERLMDTNFFGHVRTVKAFLPHLQDQGSGHIALVTSMLGYMSFYGYSAYSSSKYAIVGFAEALRQEALAHGLEVSVFYPPTTDTPGLEAENADKPALTWAIEGKSTQFTPEQVAAALLKTIRSGRFVGMAGFEPWAIYYVMRFAPWLARWIMDRDMKKHLTAGR